MWLSQVRRACLFPRMFPSVILLLHRSLYVLSMVLQFRGTEGGRILRSQVEGEKHFYAFLSHNSPPFVHPGCGHFRRMAWIPSWLLILVVKTKISGVWKSRHVWLLCSPFTYLSSPSMVSKYFRGRLHRAEEAWSQPLEKRVSRFVRSSALHFRTLSRTLNHEKRSVNGKSAMIRRCCRNIL